MRTNICLHWIYRIAWTNIMWGSICYVLCKCIRQSTLNIYTQQEIYVQFPTRALRLFNVCTWLLVWLPFTRVLNYIVGICMCMYVYAFEVGEGCIDSCLIRAGKHHAMCDAKGERLSKVWFIHPLWYGVCDRMSATRISLRTFQHGHLSSLCPHNNALNPHIHIIPRPVCCRSLQFYLFYLYINNNM